MPMRMAKTGPPTTSNCLPSSHAGTATASANSTPLQSDLKSLMSSMQMFLSPGSNSQQGYSLQL